ncbi:hypothetical protein BGZ72_011150 [Mortierella alpina]|nr:hypothetical protein BGZ72_011150 [Mortierella alpina]
MPEATAATRLAGDYSPDPVRTIEDFLARAKADPVYTDAQSRLPSQSRFFHVVSDYYDWPYEQRARVLSCPSTFHLCKSLIFENTKWKQNDAKAKDEDRYWCVLVQYEGSVNITKLEKAVRERTGDSRKGMHLRIAPAERSLEMTGHTTNGVSPVGMATDLPILISSAIADLSPAILYLGAGHVDWKIALPVQGLVDKWNATVIDFS